MASSREILWQEYDAQLKGYDRQDEGSWLSILQMVSTIKVNGANSKVELNILK